MVDSAKVIDIVHTLADMSAELQGGCNDLLGEYDTDDE